MKLKLDVDLLGINKLAPDSTATCSPSCLGSLFFSYAKCQCLMECHGIREASLKSIAQAIAWGQAMFCRGGSVTPHILTGLHLSDGLLYVGSAQQIKPWSSDDKDAGGHHEMEIDQKIVKAVAFSLLSSSRSPPHALLIPFPYSDSSTSQSPIPVVFV